jgi:hypothetical protein
VERLPYISGREETNINRLMDSQPKQLARVDPYLRIFAHHPREESAQATMGIDFTVFKGSKSGEIVEAKGHRDVGPTQALVELSHCGVCGVSLLADFKVVLFIVFD